MSQLRLFKFTADELERAALLVATLDGEILGLRIELKEAQEALRASSEALEVKDIKGQIKDAVDRLAKASAVLRSGALEE